MNYLMAHTKYYRKERISPVEGDELFSHRATSLAKAITQHPQPQYLIMSSAPNMP